MTGGSGLVLPQGPRRGIVGRLARSQLNRAPVVVLFAQVTHVVGDTAIGAALAFHDRLARRLVHDHLAGTALGVVAVTASAVSPLDGLAAAAAVAGLVGFSAASARLGFDAHVQERVPVAARASAYARYETFL